MKIASAETECADARSAGMLFFRKPGPGLGVQIEGALMDIQFGIRRTDFQRGQQRFVINGEYRLHESCSAGSGLGMADHRFYRPERTPFFVFAGFLEKTL